MSVTRDQSHKKTKRAKKGEGGSMVSFLCYCKLTLADGRGARDEGVGCRPEGERKLLQVGEGQEKEVWEGG